LGQEGGSTTLQPPCWLLLLQLTLTLLPLMLLLGPCRVVLLLLPRLLVALPTRVTLL